jgi:hypothetical protein
LVAGWLVAAAVLSDRFCIGCRWRGSKPRGVLINKVCFARFGELSLARSGRCCRSERVIRLVAVACLRVPVVRFSLVVVVVSRSALAWWL